MTCHEHEQASAAESTQLVLSVVQTRQTRLARPDFLPCLPRLGLVWSCAHFLSRTNEKKKSCESPRYPPTSPRGEEKEGHGTLETLDILDALPDLVFPLLRETLRFYT